MVKILGYTYISNCQKERKGGGVCILIRDGIPCKQRTDLDIFTGETESVFIEVLSKNGKITNCSQHVQTTKYWHRAIQQ